MVKTAEEIISYQKQKIAREKFIAERTMSLKNSRYSHVYLQNKKMNERVETILSILGSLLSEEGRQGLRLHELIKKISKSKPTILDNLNELKETLGVITKDEEKWKATEETGRFYKALEEPFRFLGFKPEQIVTFDDKTLFKNNPVQYTGSIWTLEYTKEKNPAKIVESGNVGLMIIKPAGAQPNIT